VPPAPAAPSSSATRRSADPCQHDPRGYGDALSEVFGRDYPTWQIGVQLSYAIPNRSQKASAAAAQINKDQALASYRRLELQVAQEVRTAARGVESGFRNVAAATASRVLFEQRLDAEEKKFAAGMSTNFLVTQAQRDLATAQVTELRAVADYRRASSTSSGCRRPASPASAPSRSSRQQRRRPGRPGRRLRRGGELLLARARIRRS